MDRETRANYILYTADMSKYKNRGGGNKRVRNEITYQQAWESDYGYINTIHQQRDFQNRDYRKIRTTL